MPAVLLSKPLDSPQAPASTSSASMLETLAAWPPVTYSLPEAADLLDLPETVLKRLVLNCKRAVQLRPSIALSDADLLYYRTVRQALASGQSLQQVLTALAFKGKASPFPTEPSTFSSPSPVCPAVIPPKPVLSAPAGPSGFSLASAHVQQLSGAAKFGVPALASAPLSKAQPVATRAASATSVEVTEAPTLQVPLSQFKALAEGSLNRYLRTWQQLKHRFFNRLLRQVAPGSAQPPFPVLPSHMRQTPLWSPPTQFSSR